MQRKCPSQVITSGDDAKRNSCYWAYICIGGEPFCTLDEGQGPHFVGRAYDGQQYFYPVCIRSENVRQSKAYVRRFYQNNELIYSGAIWFSILGITRVMVTYVKMLALLRSIRQRLFNLRGLNMLDRVALLEFVVNRAREKGSVRIEPMLLMSEIFSNRWILHSEGLSNEQYLKWLLDSFVESGEIQKSSPMDYQVMPKALATLDALHRDQRRHMDNIPSQWMIAAVTAALVLVGIVQSGFVTFAGALEIR